MRVSALQICCAAATLACVTVGAGPEVFAQDQPIADAPAPDPMRLIDTDKVTLRSSLSATVGAMSGAGSWFGLARPLLGASVSPQSTWGEGWLQPGLDLTLRPAENVEIYGQFSVGLSGTLGIDPYGFSNQGKVLPETAFAGIRLRSTGDQPVLDLSMGQQKYVIGTGMLIAQGAGNGAERGAATLAARVAWANAAIARLSWRGLKAEAFYLDPNEVPSENTGTKLAGGLVEYGWGEGSRLGVAHISVIASSDSYPIARSPFVVDDARIGLQSWYGWSRFEGDAVGVPGLWLRLEGATQSNDRITLKSYAWYAEASYRLAELPFKPVLSYGFGVFSGDNPRTTAIERFDPLFYGNGYENWWFGINSALAWLNSNVAYRRLTIRLDLTERDVVTAQTVSATAAQRFSPLQFNQGLRTVRFGGQMAAVTGVARTHLSDEISAAWTRQWSAALSTTLWTSAALPSSGLQSVPGLQAKPWYGGGAVIAVQY